MQYTEPVYHPDFCPYCNRVDTWWIIPVCLFLFSLTFLGLVFYLGDYKVEHFVYFKTGVILTAASLLSFLVFYPIVLLRRDRGYYFYIQGESKSHSFSVAKDISLTLARHKVIIYGIVSLFLVFILWTKLNYFNWLDYPWVPILGCCLCNLLNASKVLISGYVSTEFGNQDLLEKTENRILAYLLPSQIYSVQSGWTTGTIVNWYGDWSVLCYFPFLIWLALGFLYLIIG